MRESKIVEVRLEAINFAELAGTLLWSNEAQSEPFRSELEKKLIQSSKELSLSLSKMRRP
jgi:hypothetical protein